MLPDRSLWVIQKIGGKGPTSKLQIRHFQSFSHHWQYSLLGTQVLSGSEDIEVACHGFWTPPKSSG